MYYTFARDFGWTPTEVDEQPVYLLDWLLAINNVMNEVSDAQ